jgi:hypothetical protein
MGVIDFLVGRSVQEARYGSSFRIVFERGDRVEPALYADLAEPFTYISPTGERIEAALDRPTSLGHALTIVGTEVTRAEATDQGALHLAFSDGSAIDCDAHRQFEAWQVVGGSPESLVVSLGGGELAVWDAKSKAQAVTLRVEDLPRS